MSAFALFKVSSAATLAASTELFRFCANPRAVFASALLCSTFNISTCKLLFAVATSWDALFEACESTPTSKSNIEALTSKRVKFNIKELKSSLKSSTSDTAMLKLPSDCDIAVSRLSTVTLRFLWSLLRFVCACLCCTSLPRWWNWEGLVVSYLQSRVISLFNR